MGEGVGQAQDIQISPDWTELPRRHLAGKAKIGIMPARIHLEGSIGIVSRSGTLTYEAVHQLTQRGIASRPPSALAATRLSAHAYRRARLLNDDPETEAIIMIGEIGGSAEEAAADS